VNAHQKKDIWKAITKKVRTLGVYRRSIHCWTRWEDLQHWTKKLVEVQLSLPPLIARILLVAYPQLDGQLKAQQHLQGASSRECEGDIGQEGREAAGLCVLGGEASDTDGHSGIE
ncbi:hypothetical protein NDU88_007575, partial [Pleurodeles waltl]